MNTPHRKLSRKRANSRPSRTPKKPRGSDDTNLTRRKLQEVVKETEVANSDLVLSASNHKYQSNPVCSSSPIAAAPQGWISNSFFCNQPRADPPVTPEQVKDAVSSPPTVLFSPDHIYSQQSPPSPVPSAGDESFNNSDLLLAEVDLEAIENKPNHRHNLRTHKPNKYLEEIKNNRTRRCTKSKTTPPRPSYREHSDYETQDKPVALTTSSRCVPVSGLSKYGTVSSGNMPKSKKSRRSSIMDNGAFDSDNSLFENLDMDAYDMVHGLETYAQQAGAGDGIHSSQSGPSTDKNSPSKCAGNTPTVGCKVVPMRSSTNMSSETVNHMVATSVNTPVQPLSVRDRIKLTLSNNAKSSTTPSRVGQLRAEQLEIAMAEAEEIREQGSELDIGPFYGLPSKVRELLEVQRGIKKVYDWQNECLSLKAITEERNLIYSLPTSGGKTLVAEILILREILCKKRNCIFILPYVAIVQEKVKSLMPFAAELDFIVEEYAAAKGRIPPQKRRKRNAVFICTIEKANSLLNSLIELKRLDEVGLVVVDELHMLGEGGGRGAVLEMALAKVIHVAESTQIIGMSATLNNISDLSTFLKAEVYTNNFRPVELTEFVKLEDMIFRVNSAALCPDDKLLPERMVLFKRDEAQRKMDPDHLTGLVTEVIPDHSCLVFCSTKKNCENVGDLLCRLLPRSLMDVKKAQKKALLRDLWYDGNGQVCPVLHRTIPFGIAYHHSGLTMDERRLIEEAYLAGTLCLLCCTSTLAAGVNLPAKRVILRSPYIARDFLTRSRYKQMVGRAGRAGLDTSGESILVLQKRDKLKMLDLISGPCDVCNSSLLYEESKGMRALLLTTIGLQITPSRSSIQRFLNGTLCQVQAKERLEDVYTEADKALKLLIRNQLVQERATGTRSLSGSQRILPELEVTLLGKATFKGSVDVDLGVKLYTDLCTARESLVVANHLHLLYLVTPYDMVSQVKPDWMIYLEEMGMLEPDELKVCTIIGVPESYVAKKASGQCTRRSVDELVVTRFYLSLILYRLWKQKGIWEVASRFQLPRGFIQNLLNGAASFASCVSHFCKELAEFWAYQDLFENFVTKLSNCFVAELLPLLEVPGVKIGRARQLYKAGYKNLRQVAFASAEELVKAVEHLPKKTAVEILAAAKMRLQEQAEALQEEAEEIVTMPTDMPIVAMEMEVESVLAGDSQFSGVDIPIDFSMDPI